MTAQPQVSAGYKACVLLALGAIGSFHLANFRPWLAPAILGYAVCLFELGRRLAPRPAFYVGVITGLGVFAPRLGFLWTLFGAAAFPLWLVLSIWTALALMLASHFHRNFSP